MSKGKVETFVESVVETLAVAKEVAALLVGVETKESRAEDGNVTKPK